jgi:hypothetical protein
MPRGITDQFLLILRTEERRALRAFGLGIVAFLAAYQMARLGNDPRWGSVEAAFLLSSVVSVAIFALVGRHAARKRTFALAENWHAWMRFSVGSGSLHEVERKVSQRDPTPSWATGFAVAVFLLANGATFALLWFDLPYAGAVAYAMAIANALAVGWILGTEALRFWWARSATQAAQELVGNGTLAVWGER